MAIEYATGFLVGLLGTLGRLPDMFRSMRSGSLTEYTQVTRVEPIMLVDHTIADVPAMEDISQSLTAIFAGYYLQAAAIATNVGKIEVIKLLDKLNPARTPAEAAGYMFSIESYKSKLPRRADVETGRNKPTFGELKANFAGAKPRIVSLEAWDDTPIDLEVAPDSTTQHYKNQEAVASVARNLSTGLLLNLDVESEGHKATIPITIRLIASLTKPEILTQLISYAEKNKTMKERWHGWRSGELDFIRDIIFCQDLISAHRTAQIKDDSNRYMEILSRKNRNRISGLLSGNPSVSTASNIIVISKQTKDAIERQITSKLSHYKTRERIFQATYAMLIVVVDTDWETATIYHRGIPTPTDVTFKEFKRSNNGKGVDVNEVLKAYQLGNHPTI